jgi:2-polyprenyl-3-methyl-5-hydroxy-6-metoxy-1,4-benzoquinol methylase
MSINQISGKSVYIPKQNKQFNPQYVATREVIKKYSKTKQILELAGGPLNSTGPLIKEGYHVINIDLDGSFVKLNQKYGHVDFIKADLEHGLPKFDSSKIDIVVALDMFEHFTPEITTKLLRELKQKINHEFYLIVTMPIIDWKVVTTWTAFFEKVFSFGSKKTGLFDSTHKILKNRKYHRELLKRSGYKIVIDEVINAVNGITGHWDNLYFNRATWIHYKTTKLNLILASLISWIVHPFSITKRISLKIYQVSNRSFFVAK